MTDDERKAHLGYARDPMPTSNPQHALDLLMGCPTCFSPVYVECVGLKDGIVHLGRRIRQLLAAKGKSMADLLEAVRTNTPLGGGS